MPRIARGILLACSMAILCGPGAAAALTFVSRGVEFTDAVFVDVAAGADLTLETTEDIYIFAPNGLVANMITLEATEDLFIDGVGDITSSEDPACTPSCPSTILDLTSDVVVQILGPLGQVELRAGGSMVINLLVIPEPGTALLLGFGFFALGLGRPKRR